MIRGWDLRAFLQTVQKPLPLIYRTHISLFSFIPHTYHKPPSQHASPPPPSFYKLVVWAWVDVSCPHLVLFCIEKKKRVGVFTPTSPNLSKHSGFQTIQRCAKEKRVRRCPGLCFLSSRWVIRKEGEVFVGNLRTQDFESFWGRLWAAGSRASGSGRTVIPLFDGQEYSSIISHVKRENERKLFAFAWWEEKGDNRQKDYTSSIIYCMPFEHRFKDLVDDALAHLPPLCVAPLAWCCSTGKQWQKPSIWLQFCIPCHFEWEWCRDLQGA